MKNQIEITGALVGAVQLYSVDDREIAKLKVKVPRDTKGADTFVCVVEEPRIVQRVLKYQESAQLDIVGRLEVRYFKVGANLSSATEIKIQSIRKI